MGDNKFSSRKLNTSFNDSYYLASRQKNGSPVRIRRRRRAGAQRRQPPPKNHYSILNAVQSDLFEVSGGQ